MRRRPVFVGLVLVVVYLVALAITAVIRHDDARPLYDGFTAPTAYRFVDPPPFFASGNVKPQAMTANIALASNGTVAAGFATSDGQFVVSLGKGAIAPSPGATSVMVRVTPVAPKTLQPVPDGLRPNGNAYRVDMTYEPSGAPVAHFASPGTLLLEIPELGDAAFVSRDATTWTRLATRVIGARQLSLSAQFATPGDYVAATRLPELTAAPGRARHTAVIIGVLVGLIALALFLGGAAVYRRRRAGVQP